MRVSNLKPGVKNPNRVNVYIDGVYDFSLTLAQVVDLKVKVGRELGEAEVEELRRASAYGKLYQRALEWVLTRPRSLRETRDYLRRKDASPEDSEKIIAKLAAGGYLDDRAFAEFYVENRFVKKGVSTRRLEAELAQKGVAREVIAEVVARSGRSEAEEIRKVVERKARLKKYRDDPDALVAYLIRQGFDYQLSQSLVREMDSQSSAQS